MGSTIVSSRINKEYLRTLDATGGLGRLHRSILRAGATGARDLLVAMASRERVSWAELSALALDVADTGKLASGAKLLRAFEPREFLKVARVVALQNMAPSDRRVAFTLYRMALETYGARFFIKPHPKLFGDLAIYFGDFATAELVSRTLRLDPVEKLSLATDLLNPFIRDLDNERDWLALLNEQFCSAGVLELRLQAPGDGARSPFDRLATAPPAFVEGDEKVTVAMTTWHPDEGFPTAFASISGQSWRNLEIIVLDDCSPPGFLPLLERVVASDPRARLVRMPENRGTYHARNRALREATGTYFTVHDSDDWAHPQRIERQVRALQADPTLVSTGSRALRADDRLLFNLPGVGASRENASSLTFRREAAVSAIGFYDASRKGADTEYAVRLVEHFGPSSHRLLDEHLAFIRLSPGSLSREEFKPGWRHPSRLAYRLGYQWAHSRRKAARRPLLVPESGEGLGFQRPLRFLTNPGSEEAQRRRAWDVVYVFDARAVARQPEGVLDELIELRGHGARVALMHMESLLYPLREEVDRYHPEVLDAIGRGLVGEVIGTDEISVQTLVVRDPSVLQFAHPQRMGLHASRVLLAPDPEPGGRDIPKGCLVGAVEDKAFQLFGREPTWLTPGGGAMAGARHSQPRAWPRIRSDVRWHAPRPASGAGPLHVGRMLPPGGLSLQEGTLAQVFGAGANVARSTLLHMATQSAGQGMPSTPPGLRLRPVEHLSPAHLAPIDVYPLHGGDPEDASELANAWAAAASGCVVLWDGEWKELLGEGPACCEAPGLAALYRAISADRRLADRCRSEAKDRLKRFSGVEKMIGQLFNAGRSAA